MGSHLGERLRFLHKGLYPDYQRYFKNHQVKKENKPKDREELIVIMKTIFKHIGRNVIDRKAGVLIKGLGYFYMWLVPRKMTFKTQVKGQKLKEGFNFHTNQRMYNFIFQPLETSEFKFWSMDGRLTKPLKKELKTKIINEGVKYKAYPYSLKQLI